jgi:hypothetical protein
MDKITILCIAAIIHIIGAIIAILIHYMDGTFQWSSKNGDGFRFATPADIIFQDLFLWEIEFILFIIFSIEDAIDNFFKKIYKGV